MPHSSDSEAFESADEDVDVVRTVRSAAALSTAHKTVDIPRPAGDTSVVAALAERTKSIDLKSSATPSHVPEAAATNAADADETSAEGWDNWDDDDKSEPAAVEDDRISDAVPFGEATKSDQDADGWGKWSDGDDGDDVEDVKTAAPAATKPTIETIKPNAPAPAAVSNPPVSTGGGGGGGGWSSWSPWGGVDLVSNLLSTASDGVASITSHVSSAIESGMGVPGPEEMARRQRDEKAVKLAGGDGVATSPANKVATPSTKSVGAPASTNKGDDVDDEGTAMLFGQLVSGVQHIGSRVITGGLGTLEGIGKKTMAVLQENDPGLRNKRRMLNMDGQAPVLSQMLREAKETAEEEEKAMKLVQKQQYKKQLHFETLFDDYHGLVHLEALEMLSRQSALKLQSLLAPLAGRALDELQETLDEVKELCELPEADQLEEGDGTYASAVLADKLATAVEDLDVPVDFADIVACWQLNADWLTEQQQQQPPAPAQQVHDRALRCLAETTALAVHKMHKLAELLLVKDRHSTANEADALVQLVSTVCWHLGGIASRFGRQLSAMEATETNVNDLITSTFLEGSNSISYIQNGFQLFVPILQFGAA